MTQSAMVRSCTSNTSIAGHYCRSYRLHIGLSIFIHIGNTSFMSLCGFTFHLISFLSCKQLQSHLLIILIAFGIAAQSQDSVQALPQHSMPTAAPHIVSYFANLFNHLPDCKAPPQLDWYYMESGTSMLALRHI